jgi:hypothetical protein
MVEHWYSKLEQALGSIPATAKQNKTNGKKKVNGIFLFC